MLQHECPTKENLSQNVLLGLKRDLHMDKMQITPRESKISVNVHASQQNIHKAFKVKNDKITRSSLKIQHHNIMKKTKKNFSEMDK